MTEQELLEAIRQAHSFDHDDEAMTTNEICSATGMGIEAVRRSVKELISKGKMTPVWVYRDAIHTPLTGRMVRVPGYKVIMHES